MVLALPPLGTPAWPSHLPHPALGLSLYWILREGLQCDECEDTVTGWVTSTLTEYLHTYGGMLRVSHTITGRADIVSTSCQVHMWDGVAAARAGDLARGWSNLSIDYLMLCWYWSMMFCTDLYQCMAGGGPPLALHLRVTVSPLLAVTSWSWWRAGMEGATVVHNKCSVWQHSTHYLILSVGGSALSHPPWWSSGKHTLQHPPSSGWRCSGCSSLSPPPQQTWYPRLAVKGQWRGQWSHVATRLLKGD